MGNLLPALILLTLVMPPMTPLSSLAQTGNCTSFPETGKQVCGVFLDYWNSHGGLAQQGYPISGEAQDKSDTDGKTYTVQYFERAVFELHPENQAPYNVLLSLLGNFYYKQKYPNGATNQRASTASGAVKFSQTGHSVGGKFLEYWNSHGGLAQQGYPISDEFQERSDLDGKTYTVQYFERAVFELHPENQPPYEVLLSQLGTFRLKQRSAATQSGAAGCLATGDDLDTIGDPYFPQMGNAGYDAQRYTLDLSVDVGRNTLAGTATITAKALQDLGKFDFDFVGLTIDSLRVNGARANYTRSGQELQITPPAKIQAGQVFTTVVGYSGTPQNPDDEGNTPAPGWLHFNTGIYVASEPQGAASWYPVNDHPCDKAIYTIKVTVPKPFMAASNGLLKSTQDNGTTTTYLWESQHPQASYLTALNISRFEVVTDSGPNGVAIRHYFPPNFDPATKAAFGKTGQMIEFFNGIFGPYPFEAYGGVVADADLGFALETQTLSLFGRKVATSSTGAEEVLAHELTHQWFGDSVSLKRWQDIWLNEGFATYGQWLWVDHTRGAQAFENSIRDAYAAVRSRNPPPTGDPPADNLFNMAVYYRGGLTLHALRLEVGDDAFFKILRTYYDRYKYANASTQDFINVAQQVSGKDLTSFFQGWLHSRAMPEIPRMGLRP
jgi:hypothetical protein